MFIVRKKSVPEVVSENCYLLEAHLDHEDLHDKSKQINGQIKLIMVIIFMGVNDQNYLQNYE